MQSDEQIVTLYKAFLKDKFFPSPPTSYSSAKRIYDKLTSSKDTETVFLLESLKKEMHSLMLWIETSLIEYVLEHKTDKTS